MKIKHKGFTLIEVLIALVILSIALTAILKVTSQSIKNMRYLQDKMTAQWVAEDIINEVRLTLIRVIDTHKEKKMMLNQEWEYEVKVHPTRNERIKEINVAVFKTDEDPLIQLTSFLYAQ